MKLMKGEQRDYNTWASVYLPYPAYLWLNRMDWSDRYGTLVDDGMLCAWKGEMGVYRCTEQSAVCVRYVVYVETGV